MVHMTDKLDVKVDVEPSSEMLRMRFPRVLCIGAKWKCT